MLEVIQTVLLCIIAVLLIHSFFINLKKKRRIEAKKALLSNKSLITTHRLSEFINLLSNRYILVNKGIYLQVIYWINSVEVYRNGEIKTPTGNIQSYMNQVLKYFAEKLNESYRADEEFRKGMSSIKLSEVRDSYSEKDIQKLVDQAREREKEIEKRKKEFWTLHDTIRDLGFETWGDVSYKTYLYLKPE